MNKKLGTLCLIYSKCGHRYLVCFSLTISHHKKSPIWQRPWSLHLGILLSGWEEPTPFTALAPLFPRFCFYCYREAHEDRDIPVHGPCFFSLLCWYMWAGIWQWFCFRGDIKHLSTLFWDLPPMLAWTWFHGPSPELVSLFRTWSLQDDCFLSLESWPSTYKSTTKNRREIKGK